VEWSDVLVATSFTTSDPAAELDVAREYILNVPLPAVAGWMETERDEQAIYFEGQFTTYELFADEPPYATLGEGRIAFASDGTPMSVQNRVVNVGLTVPLGPAPEGGFPV